MFDILARLNSLLKNSLFCAVLKGHDFSRAAKLLRMSAALAAEGWFCNFGPRTRSSSKL